MPVNLENKFTRENYKRLTLDMQDHQREIDISKASIKNYEESISHHREHQKQPDVTCPNCKHSFKPNFNEQLAKELEKKIFTLSNSIKYREQQILDIKEQLELFEKWFNSLEEINDIAQHYSFMSNFWNTLLAENSIKNNPKNVATIVAMFKQDYALQEHMLSIEEQLYKEYEKLN